MKYYTGQTYPIIFTPKTGTAPTAQIKRADGLYLDFDDDTFKSSGWTTPSVTLTDQTNQWRYNYPIEFADVGTFVTEVTFGGVVYTEAVDIGMGVNLNASQAVTFDAATFRAFRNIRLAHLLSIEGWYPTGFDVEMTPAMNAGATLTLYNEVIFDEGGTRAIYNQTLGVLDSANTFTPDGSWTDAIYYGVLRLQFGGLDATFTGGWLTITASRKSDGTNPETIKLWVPATADDNFYARGDQTITRRAGGTFDSVGGPLTPSTKRVDVLFENGVDLSAIPELTADPGATPSRVEAETLLYMKSRNKQTATATTETVHNNAGTQILSHAISDSAGTTTKEKLA